MATKKPAYYQSKYRERLREKGYVKREIWIPPDYTKVLKDCEAALRAGVMPIILGTGTERKMSQDENWTTESLLAALRQSESVIAGDIAVELVEGTDPGILLIMKEFGDLQLLMSVSGSQIIVDTQLWAVDEVDDSAAFNEMILKTHKLFPLSTFGIVLGPDGRDYYEMFGSLSAGSILDSVIFEIETLADNALQAAEAYQSDLKNVA
ncbi:MAG: YjfI family protein [Rhodospirillales bacterium]